MTYRSQDGRGRFRLPPRCVIASSLLGLLAKIKCRSNGDVERRGAFAGHDGAAEKYCKDSSASECSRSVKENFRRELVVMEILKGVFNVAATAVSVFRILRR